MVLSVRADQKDVLLLLTGDSRSKRINGIDLSPDGKTLHVGESDTREIWSYRIDGNRLRSPRLVKRFIDFDIDGLRTDIAGNLYVARVSKGTIAVLTSAGKTGAGDRTQGEGADQRRFSAAMTGKPSS